jgi:hypothetical protein
MGIIWVTTLPNFQGMRLTNKQASLLACSLFRLEFANFAPALLPKMNIQFNHIVD